VVLWHGSPSAFRYRALAVKALVARAEAARPDHQADLGAAGTLSSPPAALFTQLPLRGLLGN
jgi:hypothetical protein